MIDLPHGAGARLGGLRKCGYRHAGFSLFELLVGITIVGLLGTALSERMLRYQEYAEKTAMEVTARNIATGLRMQVADLMMRDRLYELDRLLQANPIAWLAVPPPNYLGERASAPEDTVARGKWYFDSGRRVLVYTPFHRRFFIPRLREGNSVSYRVTAVPVGSSGGTRRLEGLSLLLLSPYRWDVPTGWDVF
jgi:prepilin-type N-terminal cleavage/methylation domain-containing protein